jgi:hypothetical protein
MKLIIYIKEMKKEKDFTKNNKNKIKFTINELWEVSTKYKF